MSIQHYGSQCLRRAHLSSSTYRKPPLEEALLDLSINSTPASHGFVKRHLAGIRHEGLVDTVLFSPIIAESWRSFLVSSTHFEVIDFFAVLQDLLEARL